MSLILNQLCLFAYTLFNRKKPGFCHLSFIYLIVNSNVNCELYSQCIVNSTHTVIRDLLNYISVENNFIRTQFYVQFLFPIVLHSPLISKVHSQHLSPTPIMDISFMHLQFSWIFWVTFCIPPGISLIIPPK